MNVHRTKNQHFVPQSYLKFFSEDGEKVWVFDKVNNTIRLQSIKNTGFVKYFYLTRKHPAPLDTPLVSHLEGEAKRIIQKIEFKSSPTSKELDIFLNFIALQFLRTPANKERLENTFRYFWSELRKRYRKTNPEDQKLLKKLEGIAESFIRDQRITAQSAEEFLLSNAEIKYPQEDFVDSIALHGFKIAELLASQNWEFLYTDEANNFITSDDPFSIFNIEKTDLVPALGSEATKVIPLSKKVTLAISGSKSRYRIKQMLPWAIRVINLGVASSAKRYVYSASKSSLQEIADNLAKFESNPGSYVK